MNEYNRIKQTLGFAEPDRVPIDLGGRYRSCRTRSNYKKILGKILQMSTVLKLQYRIIMI